MKFWFSIGGWLICALYTVLIVINYLVTKSLVDPEAKFKNLSCLRIDNNSNLALVTSNSKGSYTLKDFSGNCVDYRRPSYTRRMSELDSNISVQKVACPEIP